jgi:hypothetical protein
MTAASGGLGGHRCEQKVTDANDHQLHGLGKLERPEAETHEPVQSLLGRLAVCGIGFRGPLSHFEIHEAEHLPVAQLAHSVLGSATGTPSDVWLGTQPARRLLSGESVGRERTPDAYVASHTGARVRE